ncbi:MAG: flagellar M-ring protein FliF, partial [Armatimonadetes bacterium]|nr:flagellar M-ring protein FliF [Armatimonadota bacterium]
MATGMQTGMRSGMSPLSPKGGGNLFDKILQMFNNLDSKQKITGIALIGGFLFLIIIFNFLNKSSAYVELYPNNLSPLEIQEITVKLSQMNVDYKLNETGNRIFISPGNKIRTKTQLAMQGYPRRPVMPQEEKGGGIATKTKEEIDALKQARLEGELIEEIRSIEGIADAYVKVVIPDKDSFSEDATPAKAAVMLRLQPNFKLSPNQVAGIIHLVSYAVPNLDPLNVKIVGDDGRPILANENIIKGGKEIGMLTSNQQEVQANIENRLKKNIQDSLDSILGENKYTVGLSVEMD